MLTFCIFFSKSLLAHYDNLSKLIDYLLWNNKYPLGFSLEKQNIQPSSDYLPEHLLVYFDETLYLEAGCLNLLKNINGLINNTNRFYWDEPYFVALKKC